MVIFPPQRRVAILGVCVCVRGGAAGVDSRGLRLSRVPPGPPVPPAPRGLCVEATQRLCGSHTEAVGQPHRPAGRAGRPVRVDIGSRGRRATFFFQKNGKSFMRGHFKGPNENAVETFFDGASLPVIPVASDC